MNNAPRYYWRSRLDAGRALYGQWNPGIDTEGGDLAWPLYVSRYAMWQDYLLWHGREYALFFPPFEAPEPGRVSDFFDQMRPYHFGRGRAYVHTRVVRVPEKLNGKWRHTTVSRKFIRLPNYEEAKQYWLDAQ